MKNYKRKGRKVRSNKFEIINSIIDGERVFTMNKITKHRYQSDTYCGGVYCGSVIATGGIS